ncbi:MAG: GNAT family N-acetyltransferase [Bacteroidetes bacterium CG18_big_fil_WC_8_21_14_2_50_41_14]|nr:MAG: GNAT family N-acetyltransferase [Bacteroidetes bacterium CG18_big_fil_WC_8_21_14_2_50_41_14]PJB59248.1 MAG: GNAT family N-acetyltransferase [Bacteroidetes bacterium CG_4_9_14_3_um_filter_41_19]
MCQTKMFNPVNKPESIEKKEIIDFLYQNLENYGDPKADIEKCIEYAMKETPSFGGFVLVSYDGPTITGVVVVNQTGMKDYIPENILVYIATHHEMRGQGIGKKLMRDTIQMANGNIALHVEPDNPARFLYEKVGFTSKYIEMRLIK